MPESTGEVRGSGIQPKMPKAVDLTIGSIMQSIPDKTANRHGRQLGEANARVEAARRTQDTSGLWKGIERLSHRRNKGQVLAEFAAAGVDRAIDTGFLDNVRERAAAILRHEDKRVSNKTINRKVVEILASYRDAASGQRELPEALAHYPDLFTDFKDILGKNYKIDETIAARLAEEAVGSLRPDVGETKAETVKLDGPLDGFFRDNLQRIFNEGWETGIIDPQIRFDIQQKIKQELAKPETIRWLQSLDPRVRDQFVPTLLTGTNFFKVAETLLTTARAATTHDAGLFDLDSYTEWINNVPLQATLGTLQAGPQETIDELPYSPQIKQKEVRRRYRELAKGHDVPPLYQVGAERANGLTQFLGKFVPGSSSSFVGTAMVLALAEKAGVFEDIAGKLHDVDPSIGPVAGVALPVIGGIAAGVARRRSEVGRQVKKEITLHAIQDNDSAGAATPPEILDILTMPKRPMAEVTRGLALSLQNLHNVDSSSSATNNRETMRILQAALGDLAEIKARNDLEARRRVTLWQPSEDLSLDQERTTMGELATEMNNALTTYFVNHVPDLQLIYTILGNTGTGSIDNGSHLQRVRAARLAPSMYSSTNEYVAAALPEVIAGLALLREQNLETGAHMRLAGAEQYGWELIKEEHSIEAHQQAQNAGIASAKSRHGRLFGILPVLATLRRPRLMEKSLQYSLPVEEHDQPSLTRQTPPLSHPTPDTSSSAELVTREPVAPLVDAVMHSPGIPGSGRREKRALRQGLHVVRQGVRNLFLHDAPAPENTLEPQAAPRREQPGALASLVPSLGGPALLPPDYEAPASPSETSRIATPEEAASLAERERRARQRQGEEKLEAIREKLAQNRLIQATLGRLEERKHRKQREQTQTIAEPTRNEEPEETSARTPTNESADIARTRAELDHMFPGLRWEEPQPPPINEAETEEPARTLNELIAETATGEATTHVRAELDHMFPGLRWEESGVAAPASGEPILTAGEHPASLPPRGLRQIALAASGRPTDRGRNKEYGFPLPPRPETVEAATGDLPNTEPAGALPNQNPLEEGRGEPVQRQPGEARIGDIIYHGDDAFPYHITAIHDNTIEVVSETGATAS